MRVLQRDPAELGVLAVEAGCPVGRDFCRESWREHDAIDRGDEEGVDLFEGPEAAEGGVGLVQAKFFVQLAEHCLHRGFAGFDVTHDRVPRAFERLFGAE